MVAKLEQSKKETNHKIKMLKQQHRRSAGHLEPELHVFDLSEVPDENDGKTINDLRVEIAIMEEKSMRTKIGYYRRSTVVPVVVPVFGQLCTLDFRPTSYMS